MAAPQGLKIVIVDDSAAMRAVLRAIVKSDGHEVAGEAAEGMGAVNLVARLKPQVVTLDLEMPGIDGFVVLDEITRSHPGTHVLMVSATDDPFSRKRAFDLGAIGYVTKPFNAAGILDTLDQLRQAIHTQRAPVAGGKSCLVVDDNRSIRFLMRSILEASGLAVREAANGDEALAEAARQQPELVFLDVDMPGKDGLAVLAELKAARPKVPVVMVSSSTDRETITRAIGQGASGYILKPFDAEKVMAVVRRVVRI